MIKIIFKSKNRLDYGPNEIVPISNDYYLYNNEYVFPVSLRSVIPQILSSPKPLIKPLYASFNINVTI